MSATILVVEDDPPIAELVAAVLEGEGHRVLLAADGITGLEAVKRDGFDLLVTDYMLPHCNGTDLIAHMHDHPELATPVILMSAARQGRGAVPSPPTTHFVPKPFDLDHLLEMVDALLPA